MSRVLRFPHQPEGAPAFPVPDRLCPKAGNPVYYVSPDAVRALLAGRRNIGLAEAFRTAILAGRALERWHALRSPPAGPEAIRQDVIALAGLCLELFDRSGAGADGGAWWPPLHALLEDVAGATGRVRYSAGEIMRQLETAARIAVRPVTKRGGWLRRLVTTIWGPTQSMAGPTATSSHPKPRMRIVSSM
jgi:hypothetical protein